MLLYLKIKKNVGEIMDNFNLNSAKKEMKVANEFNTVPLRNFTATELDLLTTMMTQMRDRGLEVLEFDFSDLKELSRYNKETAIRSFADDLDSTYQKLISLNVKIGNDRQWTRFVLFTEYTINLDTQKIKIGTNPKFKHLINDYLELGYTQVELEEFVSLKSSYSKNLYRLLKQYRTKGTVFFNIEQFRYLMDIPESYKYGNIKQRVLSVAMKELKHLFKNLSLKEIKGRGKDKKRVVKLEFYFAKEKTEESIENKYKKSKKPQIEEDDRMTREERKEFIENKMKKRRKLIRDDVEQVKGQLDATFYDETYQKD